MNIRFVGTVTALAGCLMIVLCGAIAGADEYYVDAESRGDPVSYTYQGASPDIGAIESD